MFVGSLINSSILYNQSLFKEESWKNASALMASGKRPNLGDGYAHSEDPSVLALVHAMQWCWTDSVNDRPSARDIERFLAGELRRIKQK